MICLWGNITLKETERIVELETPEDVYDFWENRGYDEVLTDMGIPVAIEVESWCELAVVDAEWEHEDFLVTCIED